MGWELITLSAFALTVAIGASGLSVLALARIASLWEWMQRWEKTERMTPSDRAELLELRDAMTKANQTLKRVNSRLAMADKKKEGGLLVGSEPSDPAALKQYLREKAGLTKAPRAKTNGQ